MAAAVLTYQHNLTSSPSPHFSYPKNTEFEMTPAVFTPPPSPDFSYPKNTEVEMTPAVSTPPPSLDFSPSKYDKASVADEAVLAMGIPEMIVEMARAYQRQEHGTDIESAMQLYTIAEELLNNPQKQYEVGQKMDEAEQEKKTHKDLQEAEAVVKGKAAVRDTAEMQVKALTKADAQPADDKTQLKDKVQRLARENHRLRQRKMCRKCKEVDLATSGVTFLPCGHFITCETCSETFEDCPACGKSIMGTVRTFLS